jgi:hypothetical protein
MQRVFGEVFRVLRRAGRGAHGWRHVSGAHGWHNLPAPVDVLDSPAGDPLREGPLQQA